MNLADKVTLLALELGFAPEVSQMRAIAALYTPTHPAPTSTGAGTTRDTQAAGGEVER
jgi:hypothetical protein